MLNVKINERISQTLIENGIRGLKSVATMKWSSYQEESNLYITRAREHKLPCQKKFNIIIVRDMLLMLCFLRPGGDDG